MGRVWDHPQLGRFKHNGAAWVAAIELPAFHAFAYDEGGAPPSGPYELAFEADDETDVPSAAAVALTGSLPADQADLASRIAAALWDDFNGRGPGSGMWWHNGLDAVSDAAASIGLQPPAGPRDVFGLMVLGGIFVRKRIDGHEGPALDLNFGAAFEPEHGVSVLTAGLTVLGMGYAGDPVPFGTQG